MNALEYTEYTPRCDNVDDDAGLTQDERDAELQRLLAEIVDTNRRAVEYGDWVHFQSFMRRTAHETVEKVNQLHALRDQPDAEWPPVGLVDFLERVGLAPELLDMVAHAERVMHALREARAEVDAVPPDLQRTDAHDHLSCAHQQAQLVAACQFILVDVARQEIRVDAPGIPHAVRLLVDSVRQQTAELRFVLRLCYDAAS